MNIGIIVYSLSGHTMAVAQKLVERLESAGHTATLARVEVVGPATLNTEDAELKTKPAVDAYEALVLATPVRGGALPSPMRRYLEQIPSLQDKQVACLMTHYFRWSVGAEQMFTQLKAICESKGATVLGSGDVRWPGLRRNQKIEDALDRLVILFVD
jgi:flavodoxin